METATETVPTKSILRIIKEGNADLIPSLVDQGVSLRDVYATIESGKLSLIGYAIDKNKPEMIAPLRGYGVPFERAYTSKSDWSSLSAVGCAINKNSLEIIALLIEQGASFENACTSEIGRKLSAVGYAVGKDKPEMIAALKSQGASFENAYTSEHGQKLSAVGYAISKDKTDIILTLKNQGASFENAYTSEHGQKLSAVGYAIAENKPPHVIEALEQMGGKVYNNDGFLENFKNSTLLTELEETVALIPSNAKKIEILDFLLRPELTQTEVESIDSIFSVSGISDIMKYNNPVTIHDSVLKDCRQNFGEGLFEKKHVKYLIKTILKEERSRIAAEVAAETEAASSMAPLSTETLGGANNDKKRKRE